MRTVLLALFSVLVATILLLPLAGSAAPGAGLGPATPGDRWIHLALVAAGALCLFAAYRWRLRLDGPALAAAAAFGLFPAVVDAVGAPSARTGVAVAAGGALLLLALALVVSRGPATRARWLFPAVGVAVGAWGWWMADGGPRWGAPALGPPVGLAVLAGVLVGESAAEILRRRALPEGGRRAAVAVLVVALAGLAAASWWRLDSWSGPRVFWERAQAEQHSSPVPHGVLAGLAADEEAADRAAAHLRDFVVATTDVGGRAKLDPRARAAAAVGAADAAAFLLRGGDPEARSLVAEALPSMEALAPAEARPLRVVGEAYAEAGDHDRAAALLDRACRVDPADAEAWGALAGARLALGDAAAALGAAREAHRRRPGDARIVVALSEALLRTGADGEAVALLLEALGDPPHDILVARQFASVLRRLAERRLSDGHRGVARRMLMAALQRFPADAEAQAVLDRLDAERERERPQAEALLDPGPEGVTPNALVRYAAWLDGWGDYERAEPVWQRLLEARGQTAAVHYQYGFEHWEQRLTPEGQENAVRAYRQAVALDPEYVEAWNRLWKTLRKLGRIEDARRSALRFIELDRTHPDAFEAEQFVSATAEGGAAGD